MQRSVESQNLRHNPAPGLDPSTVGILDGLDLAVVVVDPAGSVLHRNDAARVALGSGDTIEAVCSALRLPSVFDGWSPVIDRVMASGEAWTVTCALPAPADGEPATGTLRCAPWRVDSEAAGAVITLQQTGNIFLLEEKLEVTQRLASLGKLATRVAHDLNNPLDGILRYVNLALRLTGDSAEPKLRTYLNESRTGLMRMVQIIGDLLSFSRTTDGAFDAVDINQVLDQALRATASAAEDRSVIVAVDFKNKDMPTVRGSRLYQVCCNLLKNAVEAMPNGGRLTVTAARVNEDVVIEVADTGSGLPDDPSKLFEPFFTTKPTGQGTGLGLAICKEFIEEMGGTITAKPGDEGGAVFTVRIPIDQCQEAPRPGHLAFEDLSERVSKAQPV